MARSTIKILGPEKVEDFTKIADSGTIDSALLTAVDSTSKEGEFTMNVRDDKLLLIVKNGAQAAKTVTVKAGTGIQGVCDLVFSVPAGKIYAVALESGRHKVVSGTDKGKVVVVGESADISAGVIRLP